MSLQTVLAVLAFLCLLSRPVSAAGELSVFFVPHRGQENVYVPLDLVLPGAATPAQARVMMRRLQAKVQSRFHPAEDGYYEKNMAKCMVQVRQLAKGRAFFRVECWSAVLWKGDGGMEQWGAYESPDEVLTFVRRFSQHHFDREREKVLRHPIRGPVRMT